MADADVTTVPAPAANGLLAPFACPSCREAFMKESACFKHVRCDFDCKGAHAMEPWSRASYGAYAFHAADWGLQYHGNIM